MNPDHYPPSPSYYRHGNADARDLVTPSYWTDSALVHLFRAGRKNGEPFADAVRNAFVCLALWFRSQGLPVPHYSAELDRLQSRIAELEAAALTAVESRPVAPALDTPAVEWTDDELEAWVVARHGKPERPNEWRKCWNWLGDANRWTLVYSGGWHGQAIGSPSKGITATEAARILNATKPDPFAALLEVETDRQLDDWFAANMSGDRAIPYTIRIGAHAHNGALVPTTWNIHGQRPGLSARDAARTLHRFLTGAAP